MNEVIEENFQPEANQSKSGKIFFAIMGLLIVASIGVTYWRIMIKKDYLIEAQTDCDPYIHECFVWECDPESDVEGEACTGDPETDSWYFQVIRRNASNVPLCDPNTDEECDALVCAEGESECEYEFCTQENMEAQYAVACNDPEQYTLDNPEEEAYGCDLKNEDDCTEVEEGAETEGDENAVEEGIEAEGDEDAIEEGEGTEAEDENCDDASAVCPLSQEVSTKFPG